MTVGSLAPPLVRPQWRDARLILPAGVAALLCFGLLFTAEAQAALRVWIDSRTYNHCFFVLPIAGWLAWDRRGAARGVPFAPTPWPALAILPLGLAWFAADRLGIMEGRQLAAMLMLQATVVALLGWRLSRVFASAIAYLIFLVPFGAFITHDLQVITTGFVRVGLDFLAVPHVITDFTIEVPTGSFYIAEACAGLRFLIAAIAFGALYGALVYRSPWKRVAFLAASVVVPVVANGLRALGTIMLSEILGNAEAAMADHIIYGWGFFSAVIVVMILAGLPFREDAGPRAPAAPSFVARSPVPARPSAAWLAAGVAMLFAAAGPAAAALLDRAGSPVPLSLPGFAATADCLTMGDPPGPVQHFACAGDRLTAMVRALPPGTSPADLRAAIQDATGERGLEDVVASQLAVPGIAPRAWRLVELEDPSRLTATAAYVDGRLEPGGIAGRLRLALDSVTGGGGPIVVVAVRLDPARLDGPDARSVAQRRVREFLTAQAPFLEAAAAASRPAATP